MVVRGITRGLVACVLAAPLVLVGCGGEQRAPEQQQQQQQTSQEQSSSKASDVFPDDGTAVGTTAGRKDESSDSPSSSSGSSKMDSKADSSSSKTDSSSTTDSSSKTDSKTDSSSKTESSSKIDSSSKDSPDSVVPANSMAGRASDASGSGSDANASRDAKSVAAVAKGAIVGVDVKAKEADAEVADMRMSLRSVSAFSDASAKPQGSAEEGFWRTVSVSGTLENTSKTADLDARCLPEMSVNGVKLVGSIDGVVVAPGETAMYSYFGIVRVPEGVQVAWGTGHGECGQDGIEPDDSSGEPHEMNQLGADGASQLAAKLLAQTKFGNRKLSHN